MRKAYVGLSSPIFYDYGNPAKKPDKRQNSSPNPILDGPFGLILLFDEIWFLTRSLCPENLRKCPYVFFVDEKDLLEGFEFDSDYEISDLFDPRQIDAQRGGFSVYESTLFAKGIHWGAGTPIDNHTHELISPTINPQLRLVGNSMDARNVVFDLAVLNYLGEGFELVLNSFTDRLLAGSDLLDVKPQEFSEAMLFVENIPNYQTPLGPHHPILDELREKGNLPHFRKWVTSQNKMVSQSELNEVKIAVEATLKETVDDLTSKYFDRKTEVKSLGKTFFGWSLDAAMPGVGRLYKLYDSWSDHSKREKARWQGFILDARRLTRK
jgi:hypothetical protein